MSKYNQCFIAEKGTLGAFIANVLAKMKGVTAQPVGKSHIIVGDDVVTWFKGHMYENAKPSEYGYKFGDLSKMPVIIPNDGWKLLVKSDSYNSYQKTIDNVKNLALNSKEIINAGDAGREGQLLIDEALEIWNINPYGDNVKRFWNTSLTDNSVREDLLNIKPNKEYKPFNDSALARSRADWMYGMTMTGMFTSFVNRAGGDNLISIGRVQTVILRIIVDRDMDRLNFKAVDYFKPSIVANHANGSLQAAWQYNKSEYKDGLITEKDIIENLKDRVSKNPIIVKSFGKTPKMEGPPLTFSLSTLNIFCAKRFDMTSDKVLEIAQSLYDKKITSYPRTDSEYLNNDQFDEVPKVIECLKTIPNLKSICDNANLSLKSKVWNSSKVTDHYAIIPTEEATFEKIEKLSSDERKVFDIIAKQYLAQFYPEKKWDSMNAILECGSDRFKASGNQQTSPGWKVVFNGIPDEDNEDNNDELPDDDLKNTLPEMKVGDIVDFVKFEYGANKTKRPPIMNDATLEMYLNSPYLLEKDPEIKRKIKETDGIGRTSTRPPIMKVLIDRGYIVRGKRKKVEMESTQLARSLISVLPEEVKAIGMTAIWEGFLEKIKNGELSLDKFLDATKADLEKKSKLFISKYGVSGLKLDGIKKNKLDTTPLEGDGEKCSQCGNGTMKTFAWISKKDNKPYKALFCVKDDGTKGCDNAIFPKEKVEPLMGDGEKCSQCGNGTMKTFAWISKKDNKPYKALFCVKDDGTKGCDNAIFPNTSPPVKPLKGHGEICPKCGDGKMITRQRYSSKMQKNFVALFCEKPNGVKGCDYVQFENNNEKVAPIEGHGEKCPLCNKGILKTIKFKDKNKKDCIALACKTPDGATEKACEKLIFDYKKSKKNA